MKLPNAGRASPLLALLAGLLAPCAATAAERVVPTSLPSVEAFPAPPAGFDPRTASDPELEDYGYPPRPDRAADPRAYAEWEDEVAPDIVRVIPKLRRTDDVTPRLRKPTGETFKDPNWSGYIFQNDNSSWGKSAFKQVSGRWTVPSVQPPFGACKGKVTLPDMETFVWVGIDGVASGAGLIQAGTSSQALCTKGKTSANYWTWYEWVPDVSIVITNIDTRPGDVFTSTVSATSPTSGRIYIVNMTTRQSASMRLKAPAGGQLLGQTAEWIVERPQVDGEYVDLANYIHVIMTKASATAQGKTFIPSKTPPKKVELRRAIMVDDNDKTISIPSILGDGALSFRNVGSSKNAD